MARMILMTQFCLLLYEKSIENQFKIGPVCYIDMPCFSSLVIRIRIYSKISFLGTAIEFSMRINYFSDVILDLTKLN